MATAATAPGAAYLREFRTIYPGWYPSRTIHIHTIVRTPDAVSTSQLYFPDELSDAVLAAVPYWIVRSACSISMILSMILPTFDRP